MDDMLSLAILGVGFFPMVAIFYLLERAKRKRRNIVDWVYWPFSALVIGNLSRGAVYFVAAVLTTRFPKPGIEEIALVQLQGLPLFVEVPLALLVADFVAYFSHRIRHRIFWPVHAVHHSPKDLGFIHGARMHWLDDMVDSLMVGLTLLFLGVSPIIFLVLAPMVFLHTMLIHADLNWSFGPLGFLFVSPRAHRKHHELSKNGEGTNFGSILVIWDLLFRTFSSDTATQFGVSGRTIPESLLGQQLVSVFPAVKER